mmetsp:Transcript_112835/g.319111  ORF Transcript_112835/g.319111 Transcript_112835/m.319111 type:complete len:235 (-) Transcript_112835:132-836(-)
MPHKHVQRVLVLGPLHELGPVGALRVAVAAAPAHRLAHRHVHRYVAPCCDVCDSAFGDDCSVGPEHLQTRPHTARGERRSQPEVPRIEERARLRYDHCQRVVHCVTQRPLSGSKRLQPTGALRKLVRKTHDVVKKLHSPLWGEFQPHRRAREVLQQVFALENNRGLQKSRQRVHRKCGVAQISEQAGVLSVPIVVNALVGSCDGLQICHNAAQQCCATWKIGQLDCAGTIFALP